MKNIKRNYIIASSLLIVFAILFLFYGIGSNWEFALKLRSLKLVAILVVSGSVAYSTLAFQTITNNRILTPSIMGFESVYSVADHNSVHLW